MQDFVVITQNNACAKVEFVLRTQQNGRPVWFRSADGLMATQERIFTEKGHCEVALCRSLDDTLEDVHTIIVQVRDGSVGFVDVTSVCDPKMEVSCGGTKSGDLGGGWIPVKAAGKLPLGGSMPLSAAPALSLLRELLWSRRSAYYVNHSPYKCLKIAPHHVQRQQHRASPQRVVTSVDMKAEDVDQATPD